MFGLERKLLIFLLTGLCTSWATSVYFLFQFQFKNTLDRGTLEQDFLDIAQKLGVCLPNDTLESQPGDVYIHLFFVPILCFEAILCSRRDESCS